MPDDECDEPGDRRLSRERASELEMEALLSQLESARQDVRAIVDRQATLVRNGIAAGGLVLAYSFAQPVQGSVLAVLAVPVIIVAATVLSMEADANRYAHREHANGLEKAIECRSSDIPDAFASEDLSDNDNISAQLTAFYYVLALFYFGIVGWIVVVVPGHPVVPALVFARSASGVEVTGWTVVLFVFYLLLTVLAARAISTHPAVEKLGLRELLRL